MNKTIYILGGTNGVGKTFFKNDLIPEHIPYVNADFIAKGLSKQQQQGSVMLSQLAQQYGSEKMRSYIQENKSFSFENNMHQESSYKWLSKQQAQGYEIQLYYIGVSDLKITEARINERVKRGEHYVPPDEVYARYQNGMVLLKKYFAMPDRLVLIDNSTMPDIQMVLNKGKVLYQSKLIEKWALDFANGIKNENKILPGN